MTYSGKDVTIAIGGVEFPVSGVEFGGKVEAPQLDRTPGVYVANAGPFYVRRLGMCYPGEGNRLARRTAAKGQVRR